MGERKDLWRRVRRSLLDPEGIIPHSSKHKCTGTCFQVFCWFIFCQWWSMFTSCSEFSMGSTYGVNSRSTAKNSGGFDWWCVVAVNNLDFLLKECRLNPCKGLSWAFTLCPWAKLNLSRPDPLIHLLLVAFDKSVCYIIIRCFSYFRVPATLKKKWMDVQTETDILKHVKRFFGLSHLWGLDLLALHSPD